MLNQSDVFGVTAFFSAMLHAVIILGISFKLPEIANLENTDNTLDVVLINMPNNEKPTHAETVSTHDNLGGGEQEEEASAPTPWKVTDSQVESIALVAEQTESSPANEKIIQGDGIQASLSTPTEEKEKIKEPGKAKITTRTQRQLEKERLIAKMNERWQKYQKRPRRTYLSPTTKQHDAAEYLDRWRKKVEAVGNASYPQQAKTDNLSGSLIIDVAINRDGTIDEIKVLTPSKYKLLNDAAVRFVRMASPYDAFPDSLKKTSDIIHITRAFHFLGSHRLSSSDASSIQ